MTATETPAGGTSVVVLPVVELTASEAFQITSALAWASDRYRDRAAAAGSSGSRLNAVANLNVCRDLAQRIDGARSLAMKSGQQEVAERNARLEMERHP